MKVAVSPSALEALLFAAADPVPVERLAEALGCKKAEVLTTARELAAALDARASGLSVEEVGGGFRLATRAEYSDAIETMLARTRRARLTPPSLETLAIVAYRQPISRAGIEALRGVDSGGVLATLIEREFIKVVGTAEGPGNPLLYGTTKDFLTFFGFESIRALPPIEQFAEVVRSKKEGDETWDDFTAHAEVERKRLAELADTAGRNLAEIEERYRKIRVPGALEKKKKSASAESAPTDPPASTVTSPEPA